MLVMSLSQHQTESGNMTETQDADVFLVVCWKFWADYSDDQIS